MKNYYWLLMLFVVGLGAYGINLEPITPMWNLAYYIPIGLYAVFITYAYFNWR